MQFTPTTSVPEPESPLKKIFLPLTKERARTEDKVTSN
jgi:hypothetical protein